MRRALCLLLLLAAPDARAEEDLRLVLAGPERPVHAGDSFVVTAELRGAAVERLAASVKERRPPPFGKDAPRFSMPITLVAGPPGTMVVGPFELEAFGRKLRTDAVRVEVKPAPPAQLELAVEPARVRAGTPFRLVATLKGHGAVKLRENPQFQVRSRSTSVELKTEKGVQTILSRATYELVSAKAGTLRFDRDSFDDVPADTTVTAVVVEVR